MTFLTAGLSPLWTFQSGGVMYYADTSEINPKAIDISIKPCAVVVDLQQPLIMGHLQWLGKLCC